MSQSTRATGSLTLRGQDQKIAASFHSAAPTSGSLLPAKPANIKPLHGANGPIGRKIATAMMMAVITSNGMAARLCGNGNQGLRQRRRNLATDRGVGRVFQQRQSTEVPRMYRLSKPVDDCHSNKYPLWGSSGRVQVSIFVVSLRPSSRASPLPQGSSVDTDFVTKDQTVGAGLPAMAA